MDHARAGSQNAPQETGWFGTSSARFPVVRVTAVSLISSRITVTARLVEEQASVRPFKRTLEPIKTDSML
jgi:hypothetical protein